MRLSFLLRIRFTTAGLFSGSRHARDDVSIGKYQIVYAQGTESPISVGHFHIATEQWREAEGNAIGPIKDVRVSDFKAEGQLATRILILSGDSGAGKSTFALLQAYKKFRTEDMLSIVTYYVSANRCKAFENLTATLAAGAIKEGGISTKGAARIPRELRDAECAEFMKNLITTARKETALYRNWMIHIVIDECGQCREAVRGIVSAVGKWANSDVRLTLCSAGLDLTITCEDSSQVYVRSDPCTATSHYKLLHLTPWTPQDAKDFFERSLGADFKQFWKMLESHPTLLALTANARCARYIQEYQHCPPPTIVWEVAKRYKAMNRLKNLDGDPLRSLIRTTLFYAVGPEEVKAYCKAFGIDFKEPSPEEVEEASDNGMLSLRKSLVDELRDRAVPLSRLPYDVTCAMVALCAVEFGNDSTAIRTHTGFKEIVGHFCHSALTAVGVKNVAFVKMGQPIPPEDLLSSAAKYFGETDDEKSVYAGEFMIPTKYLQITDGKLDLINDETGIVVINADLAPSWDVAAGFKKGGGITEWVLYRAKYTAKRAPLCGVDWKREIPKLGTTCKAPQDAQTQGGETHGTAPLGETPPSGRELSLLAWLKATMNVARRCLISNGRLKDKVPDTVLPVEFIEMEGPFAALAALPTTRQSMRLVKTDVFKTSATEMKMKTAPPDTATTLKKRRRNVRAQ